ncbi:helix-turn-helix transcriptional regulator [Streptomyces venezuelae]|uniref:helix-turn-helix transcriptional regulator n=1 Tax=Streptomyces venezuelae TaxID=54571 RepID=UPI0034266183
MDTSGADGGVNGVVQKVATLKNQIERVGMSVDELIDFPDLARLATIPEDVIRRLFEGEAVAAEEIDLPFPSRLRHLMRTKRHADGSSYTQAQIAAAIEVSTGTIQSLVSGARNPGFDVGRKLESLFEIPAGRLSRNGSDALSDALDRTVEGVMLMAELKGIELAQLSLRGSSPLAGNDALARAVRGALDEAEAQRRAAPTENLQAREISEELQKIPEAERGSFIEMIKHSARLWRRPRS